MKISVFFISALAFLCGLRASHAQELTQTFTSPEGFSIKLPADWKRIDKQTLDDSTKELGENMPNARFQNPSDGFEPNSIQQGIGYPFVIVVPNPVGNITEQEFKNLAVELKGKLQQKANSIFKDNTLNASANVGSVNYDEQNQSIQVVTIGTVPNFGQIRSVDIIFRTESGMLTFKFAVAETEYNQNTDLFSKIIASIEEPKAVQPVAVPTTTSVPTDDSGEKNAADNSRVDYIAKHIGVWICLIILGAYWVGKNRKK